MRVVVWNCQGVGSPLTVPQLREVNHLSSPNIFFLSETKNMKTVIDRIARRLRLDNNVSVEAMNRTGGMALLWTKDTQIVEVVTTAFTIEAKIEGNESQAAWWFIGVYASCDRWIRKEQWRVLTDRSRLWGSKYLISGDFNDILSNEEKWEGVFREERSFKDFRHFIELNRLVDIGFEGHPWTWSNHWDNEGEIRQRLDRALGSMDWFQDFESAKCHHIETLAFDHSLLLLDTNPGIERKKKETNSRSKIDSLKQDLEKTRNAGLANKKEKCQDLKRQLANAYKEEEAFWSQKSRISWLREGGKNTKYFHSFVKGRRVSNRLNRLQREDGSWTANEEEVVTELSEYFKDLFTSGGKDDMTEILEGIPHYITQEMNDKLTKEVMEEEIHDALFSMNPEKAPGQDGMTPLFFQKFWNTIKSDIILAIKAFFHSGHMLKSVNHTVISLIPKILHPTNLKNFRPISLCSVLYKIISKILANRLKSVLDLCISKTQSAFIPERQILDNVIIAHEYMHFLKNKKTRERGIHGYQIGHGKGL
ncbi:uncharacterized protein [Coffea arabica]|uniref:Reverse transcriptase domain-containing protein n=1 Tax=Coffea arabica TaxID=13443 RepID=A0ABM4W224_COFAR